MKDIIFGRYSALTYSFILGIMATLLIDFLSS
jgi:hypothetical protein